MNREPQEPIEVTQFNSGGLREESVKLSLEGVTGIEKQNRNHMPK